MANWNNPDVTEQVEAFMAELPPVPGKPTQAIIDAVDYVAEYGPSTGRPLVGEVSLDPDYRDFIPLFGRHLKEIRPLGTKVRILCLFGSDRTLVLLVAGDKEGEWNSWYRWAIPEAARLYREYLKEFETR
jgi:hypothetical protein